VIKTFLSEVVKMSDELKQIIESAIKDEEYFFQLYKRAASKTAVASVKKLFLWLSEQEQVHKQKLQALSPEQYGGGEFADLISDIDVMGEVAITPIDSFKNEKAVFEFAIKGEVTAKSVYAKLAGIVVDSGQKKLFKALSAEEKKHEELLKSELKKLK
jgi:rubrerythrin